METIIENKIDLWFKVASEDSFPSDSGVNVKYKDEQIAVFNFSRTGKWYATQNLCPHKKEMVLSRGMLGDSEGLPKVACPMHKKNFCLESGDNINGDLESLKVYPVKVVDGFVYIGISK